MIKIGTVLQWVATGGKFTVHYINPDPKNRCTNYEDQSGKNRFVHMDGDPFENYKDIILIVK